MACNNCSASRQSYRCSCYVYAKDVVINKNTNLEDIVNAMDAPAPTPTNTFSICEVLAADTWDDTKDENVMYIVPTIFDGYSLIDVVLGVDVATMNADVFIKVNGTTVLTTLAGATQFKVATFSNPFPTISTGDKITVSTSTAPNLGLTASFTIKKL